MKLTACDFRVGHNHWHKWRLVLKVSTLEVCYYVSSRTS